MNSPSHRAEALQLQPFGSQWEQIKRYFATGRRRKYDLRYHVLDAILYIVKTGTQWRMLPGEFARWRATHYYFRRWREEGRIRCILSITCRSARRRDRRHGEPSALIVDCQSVPSARAGGISSFDAFRGGPWPKTTYCCPRAGIALGPDRTCGRGS
ncbi:transposase [Salinibacter ruber]|uniref:transposase n=1 Tax=Salinibacter ruber TaxID=146919 RepID=UPI001F07444F